MGPPRGGSTYPQSLIFSILEKNILILFIFRKNLPFMNYIPLISLKKLIPYPQSSSFYKLYPQLRFIENLFEIFFALRAHLSQVKKVYPLFLEFLLISLILSKNGLSLRGLVAPCTVMKQIGCHF